MPRAQVIEQPNGLLGIFDPNIESWVIWDATEDELVEFYTSEASRKAEQVIRDHIKGVTKDDPRSVYGKETLSFKSANERHLANDGEDLFS